MPANRCGGCDIAILAPAKGYGIATPGIMTLAKVYDSEANARLIASAPDLLAALEELERLTVWVGGQNPVHDAIESAKRKARAAIARATIAKATAN